MNKVKVTLPEELANGEFANSFMIFNKPGEFCIDFLREVPNVPEVRVVARVILTSIGAKELFNTLEENIKAYEKAYGEIKVTQQDSDKKIGFIPKIEDKSENNTLQSET